MAQVYLIDLTMNDAETVLEMLAAYSEAIEELSIEVEEKPKDGKSKGQSIEVK